MAFRQKFLYLMTIILTHILFQTLVQGQEVNEADGGGGIHSILECDSPLESLLSNVNEGHFVGSIFSDLPGILEDLKCGVNLTSTTMEGEKLMSTIAFQNLDNYSNSFSSAIDFNGKNNLERNFVIIIPKEEDMATQILNQIGLIETTKVMKSKTAFFIIWPTTCTEMNCLQKNILNQPFQTLPPVSSDTYIVHCGRGDGGSTNLTHLDSTKASWDMYSFYSVGRENSIRLDPVPPNDLHESYYTKSDFRGATIKAVVPASVHQEEILVEVKEGGENGTTAELKSGLSADVAFYLRDSLRFKLELLMKNGSFKRVGGAEWSELAQQLLRDQVDISLVKDTQIPFRQEVFHFLNPHFVDGVQAYFRQPPASSIRNIFLEPFTMGVWGTLIAVWFLVGLSTVVAAHIKAVNEQLLEEDKEISKNSILWAIALTCQQGWHLDPQSISMKVIFFCGSLMSLIIYVAFSAALVSSLSTAVIPIKKLGDLLQNNFLIALQPDSQTLELILENEEFSDGERGSGQIQVAALKSKTKKVKSKQEGVNMVLKRRAAYLSFPDNFYTTAKGPPACQTDKSLCETISSVKFSSVPFRSGMIVSKNSPYKEYFNHRIICLYENGLMRRFQRGYILSFRGECDKQPRKKGQNLGMHDLFTAYVVILSGYALSLTIFLMELLYARQAKAKENLAQNNTQQDD